MKPQTSHSPSVSRKHNSRTSPADSGVSMIERLEARRLLSVTLTTLASFNGPVGYGDVFELTGGGFVTASKATLTLTPPTAQTVRAGNAKLFTLGSFTETGATGPYTVNVNWGDGSANTQFKQSSAGKLALQNHTFAKAGAYTVSVTVTDANGNASNAATFSAKVSPAIKTVNGPALYEQAGVPFETAVGFYASPVLDPPGAYAASINWGDGSTSQATLHYGANGAAYGYLIDGSHTYAKPGKYVVTTTLDIGPINPQTKFPTTVIELIIDQAMVT